jgi:hypothetical protein
MIARIEEIQARLERAWRGPWLCNTDAQTLIVYSSPGHNEPARTIAKVFEFVGNRGRKLRAQRTGDDLAANNASLIANAPADLAYLLARVEKLEALLRKARNSLWADDKMDLVDREIDAALGEL